DRQARVAAGLAETETTLAAAQARWDREKALVAEILDLRAKLRGEGVPLDAAAAEEAVAETESVAGAAKAPEQKLAESKTVETKRAKASKTKAAAKAEAASAEPVDEAAADLARLRELM
ncbi:type VI secretion system ATPase TssH, partial [Mesorhizobium sp. M2E.F.Ca.ET.154.01.1.1]